VIIRVLPSLHAWQTSAGPVGARPRARVAQQGPGQARPLLRYPGCLARPRYSIVKVTEKVCKGSTLSHERE
jgi:hypothetical protein